MGTEQNIACSLVAVNGSYLDWLLVSCPFLPLNALSAFLERLCADYWSMIFYKNLFAAFASFAVAFIAYLATIVVCEYVLHSRGKKIVCGYRQVCGLYLIYEIELARSLFSFLPFAPRFFAQFGLIMCGSIFMITFNVRALDWTWEQYECILQPSGRHHCWKQLTMQIFLFCNGWSVPHTDERPSTAHRSTLNFTLLLRSVTIKIFVALASSKHFVQFCTFVESIKTEYQFNAKSKR